MSKAAEQMGFAGDFDAGLATEEKQRAGRLGPVSSVGICGIYG